ncbi:hypothetical protein HanRHA438_Chr10g0443101 [Helianthus annuus]|nr:hypothetical protein HanRHA438_Chr10g0443101 [Helianthus annuus]
MRWSSKVRLKSPGTEKTSETPIWTRRRARWRPSVASPELKGTGEDWMQQVGVSLGGLPRLPLVAGVASKAPMILVSMNEYMCFELNV